MVMSKDSLLLIGQASFPYDPAEGNKAALIKEVIKADKRRRKLLDAVRNAADDFKLFKKKQYQYVHSNAVRFSALLEAAGSLPFSERQTLAVYREIARETKYASFEEAVHVRLKSKGNGRYRHYCVFGPNLRAAHLILRDLLEISFMPQNWQFGVRGRGMWHAVRLIRDHYEAGKKFAAVLDIRSFFDGFRHSELGKWATLPVNQKLMMRSAIGRHLNLRKGDQENQTHTYMESINYAMTYLKTAGLLPGSAISGMAAAHVLSKLSPKLPTNSVIINYVDDFLVLTESESDLHDAVIALRASIEAIPAGNFELLEKSSGSFSSGFVYVGHLFSVDTSGILQIHVSNRSADRFTENFHKACDRLEALAKGHVSSATDRVLLHEQSAKLAARVISWGRSFSEADDAGEHVFYFECVLSSLVESLGLNWGEILAGAETSASSGGTWYNW